MAAAGRVRLRQLLALVALLLPLVRAGVPHIPKVWTVVGPFPLGMRELGADPLAAFAGDWWAQPDATFPSEIADGGYVGLSSIQTAADGRTVGPIVFEEPRWSFNRDFWGWAFNQWQGWARGEFHVDEAGAFLVRCQNIGEFFVDDQLLHGDWYAYGHSWALVELSAGTHAMRLRLMSAIRIFGGALPPSVTVICEFRDVETGGLVARAESGDTIAPDAVDGLLAGTAASVQVLNSSPSSAITVTHVELRNASAAVAVRLAQETRLQPGQARPLALVLSATGELPTDCASITVAFDAVGRHAASSRVDRVPLELQIVCRAFGDAYAFTFFESDGSAHYAMARPPAISCTASVGGRCPVLVAMHGAGVEASSPSWTSAYPRQNHSWLLFPTGRTPWGYDWHGASRVNVDTALSVLSASLPGVPPSLRAHYAADAARLFVAGHSNGGQGAWFYASHYTDRVLAVTPAAGYAKIQLYVPYFLRLGDAHADPQLRALLETSIAEFDTDLYADNLVGLPLRARTGGSDDNVPPLHSRRLVRVVCALSGDAHAATLREDPGQGHWFDGIMSDEHMAPFIAAHTDPAAPAGQQLPPFPRDFTHVTLNPASSGFRGALRVLQQRTRGRASRVHVAQSADGAQWALKTSNVRRLAVNAADARTAAARTLVVDGQPFDVDALAAPDAFLVRGDAGDWQAGRGDEWALEERGPDTYGPLLQLLDGTTGRWAIVVGTRGGTARTDALRCAARTLANDWAHYAKGDVAIVDDSEADAMLGDDVTRLFVLGGPDDNSVAAQFADGWPVTFLPGQAGFAVGGREYAGDGIGALFLAPCKERMAAVLAGTDALGIRLATELFPVQTGVTTPDFVIAESAQFAYKGAGGILAAGFWDNHWRFDAQSAYLT